MMMTSRAVVYAVLAVALGYLLISIIPATLIPHEKEILRPSDEKSPLAEAPGESTFKRSEETQIGKGVTWNEALKFSFLIIDLLIALGIYFIARRRLA